MKKVFLFIFVIMLTITGLVNVNAYDKYDGDYTIEYLLRNYSVVTLGTKPRYDYSVMNNSETEPGSVTNVFDIGGPVLIRGNYSGNSNYDNEFAQKTEGVPSYIKGKMGTNINPGSIESAEISNIYVGSSNALKNDDGTYSLKNSNNEFNYPIIKSDDYLDFDKLYAAIVNEQKNIEPGKKMSLKNQLDSDYDYDRFISKSVKITEPGYYEFDDLSDVQGISIDNYDPNKLYVFTSKDEAIYSMPIFEGFKGKSGDEIYCGRTNDDEVCTGNIIWNFPNARFVYTNYNHGGHIIAPKADVELVETYYPGTIIANSITGRNSDHTAIQFYPYNLNKKFSNTNMKTTIKEKVEESNDLYQGNYSIDELLKNYSIVTLGQKEYEDGTKLSNLTNNKGTAAIFHIGGQFLINGDLGIESIKYLHNLKLDLKANDLDSSSYVSGNLMTNTWDVYYWRGSFNNAYFNGGASYFKIPIRPYLYFGSNNSIEYNSEYADDYKLKPFYLKVKSSYPAFKVTNGDSYLSTFRSTHISDNYINFKVLYDAIVEQQKKITAGTIVKPDNENVINIPIGGNYTIEGINDATKIRFTNYNDNKNKLTIVTINDEGHINMPFENSDSWSNSATNDWYGKKSATYGEYIQQESYHGNIVFNIPNATYIKLASGNSFKGHIIAPNADVETPEMHFSGSMIVNSLYTEGNTEAHFYPLTVGSVGTGIELETKTIGDSKPDKITISGIKQWDAQDEDKPESIIINLLANGKKVDSVEITEDDNWKYEFKDLDRVDSKGVKIEYHVTETSTTSAKYDGDYTIEYLLKNYNLVTLGTKLRYNYSIMDNTEYNQGSVTNVFDIGGPVLIRGNYTGNSKYDNEFAQKTNCIPSYIQGKMGTNINPGSIESAELSNIYVGSQNVLQQDDGTYKLKGSNNEFKYPIIKSDDYLDFDKLYAAIVNEQKNIDRGTMIFNNSEVDKYFYYNTKAPSQLIISEPGYYEIEDISYLVQILIKNYDPNEIYVITTNSEVINAFPVVTVRKGETGDYILTDDDVVYSGREGDELYSGNIIWNIPNARYIYTNPYAIGHIIAPNADIELYETHYPGTIIANSVTSVYDKHTAVQFYPLSEDVNLNLVENDDKVVEKVDINKNDIYNGNYSIDELLKNYSIVTLGQKDYHVNSKLKNLTNKKGTAHIFHAAGQLLISGDLGIDSVSFYPDALKEIRGIKLDLRTNDLNAHSYIAGSIKDDVWDSYRVVDPEDSLGHRRYAIVNEGSSLIPFRIHNGPIQPTLYLGSSNTITEGGWYLDKEFRKYEGLRVGSRKITYQDNTFYSSHESYNSDNYIDFKTLYDAIVEQQKKIEPGTTIRSESCGRGSCINVTIGKNYTVENISGAGFMYLKNIEESKDKLTIITINDSGEITLPGVSMGTCTNDFIGGYTFDTNGHKYSCNEQYYGNIVWNVPNATHIKLSSLNFVGHIIAPNADVETSETNFAGAVIANSLYTAGRTEAHFYPLTVGSVGKGINQETNIIDTPIQDKITISGTKIWNDKDNQDGLRPESVTINLHANGEKIDSLEITEDDNWKYEFKDVDRVDSKGVKVIYTITENSVENYSTEIEDITFDNCPDGCVGTIKGYNITNSYTPKKTSLTVNKVWNDDNNKKGIRPDKQLIQLYANGEKIGDPMELNEENNWTYIFNELDMRSKGKDIKYTVKEVTNVDGYTYEVTGSQEEGYTIINTIIEDVKENPDTGDSIFSFTIISIISSIILVAGIIVFTKMRGKRV